MMGPELTLFLSEGSRELETELKRCMPVSSLIGSDRLNQAIHDALFPGGKRMRPLLTLLAAHTAGGPWRNALPVACAVEYLHTCSLILDDLPCMDGASERRGRRPTHVAYGESTAILAAIALLNRTWALLYQNGDALKEADRTRRLIEEASRCLGPDGIIAGQFFDLLNGKRFQAPPESFLKTAGITRFMLGSGAIMADASESAVEALASFGQEFGTVYQMLDDVIDMEADARTGPAGQAVLLVDQARALLNRSTDGLLRFFNDGSAGLLLEFARQIFEPMIDRSRECMRSETADIREP